MTRSALFSRKMLTASLARSSSVRIKKQQPSPLQALQVKFGCILGEIEFCQSSFQASIRRPGDSGQVCQHIREFPCRIHAAEVG